jgi:hypothetical protein
MAYKRTTRKTGPNSRSTTTLNTNGTNTQSSSIGIGSTRITSSSNSKTGSKVTQTITDGNGYVHKKTIFSSAGAARDNKKRQKQAEEFGKSSLGSWIVFGLLIWGAYAIFA